MAYWVLKAFEHFLQFGNTILHGFVGSRRDDAFHSLRCAGPLHNAADAKLQAFRASLAIPSGAEQNFFRGLVASLSFVPELD